ncbi:hypothetical protein OQA88_412 [Cercophora sp. LCS_1]
MRSFQLLALALALNNPVQAQESTTSSTSDATTPTSPGPTPTTSLTRVVQIFFIDERSYEGLPYTLVHRDSGSVLGINADLTTYVITSTRVDQRPVQTQSVTENGTTTITTLGSSRRIGQITTTTGQPSTITQGPATFMFTGTRYGPDHTLCSLNGTESAVCNLTHVGSAWYAKNTAWNGTFSTYSYNWTSGDRFGFAPVTITEGAELLQGSTPTASGGPNPNAGVRVLGGGEGGILAPVVAGLALGLGFILGL